ncbi:MAG: hypothetical protein JXQ90_13455 [Cyclobacteriaceae bacterium]
MKSLIISLFSILVLAACSSTSNEDQSEGFGNDPNPHAEGFDVEGSGAISIIIADKVMTAMGGRAAWDRTRYITWNFFGSRTLLWDKHAGNVRIQNHKEDEQIIVNVNDGTGKVWRNGKEIADSDSLSNYLNKGKRIWINDSYWLVMPFKLKDSGVTLHYLMEDETQQGEKSDVLRLTFKEVGVTPGNAYEIWISQEDNLVKQWAYYRDASDDSARFTLPWGNYQKMGDILLSSERGERDLTDVRVLSEVPENVFEDFGVSMP